MKIVYNWLKEFVDVKATPDELASRLALSGTNIGGIENGPHGAVVDAEVSSNRPIASATTALPRSQRHLQRSLKPVTPRPKEISSGKTPQPPASKFSSRTLWPLHARVIRSAKIQPSRNAQRPPRSLGVASINNVVDATTTSCSSSATPSTPSTTTKFATPDRGPRRQAQRKNPHFGRHRTHSRTRHLRDLRRRRRPRGRNRRIMAAPKPKSFLHKKYFAGVAWFDPIAIRRAAAHLKLHTEASTRFGRGADPKWPNSPLRLRRTHSGLAEANS